MRRHVTSVLLASVILATTAAVFGAEKGDESGEVIFERIERRKGLQIAKVTFEHRTYELWREWLEDSESVQKATGRVANLEEYEKWLYWIDTSVKRPAIIGPPGKARTHELGFTSGGLRPMLARSLLRSMLRGFERDVISKGDVRAIEFERARNESEMAKLVEERDRIRGQARELERRANEFLDGESHKRLRIELAQIEKDLYATNLELVQVQARLDVLRKNLTELAESWPQAETLSQNLHTALDQLNEFTRYIRSMGEQDRVSQEELKRLENVKQVVRGAGGDVSGLSKRVRDTAEPLYLDLKQKLVDAETQFAELTAKNKFMEERRTSVQQTLKEADQMYAKAREIEATAAPIERKMEELSAQHERIGPERYGLPRPVVVWAGIPENER